MAEAENCSGECGGGLLVEITARKAGVSAEQSPGDV